MIICEFVEIIKKIEYNEFKRNCEVDGMKRKLIQNVNLEPSETVLREFRNMPAKAMECSMLVTNHRLIIYTYGRVAVKGRMVKRRAMNEIDLKAIHKYEFYYESVAFRLIVRFIGLLLFLGGIFVVAATFLSMLTFTIPGFPTTAIHQYAFGAILSFIGLFLMFHANKTLYLKIKSSMTEVTALELRPTKFNEEALKFIAGRIRVR